MGIAWLSVSLMAATDIPKPFDVQAPKNVIGIRELVRESVDENLACLQKLGSRDTLTNAEKLRKVVADPAHHLTVKCFASSSVRLGRATAPGEPGFPRIELNVESSQNTLDNQTLVRKDLKRIIFHELLHTIGFRHGIDVDFPYACSVCCSPDARDSADHIETACRICKGGYSTSRDARYLKDAVHFAEEDDRMWAWVEELSIRGVDEAPKDRTRKILVMKSMESVVLQREFAKEFKRSYSDLSPEEEEYLGRALNSDPSEEDVWLEASAKQVARGWATYWNGDLKKAGELVAHVNFPDLDLWGEGARSERSIRQFSRLLKRRLTPETR